MSTHSLPWAVIFDMDGVLLDSEPIHYDALNETLAPYGHHLTPEDNENLLGTTVDDSFRWLATRFGLTGALVTYINQYDEQVLARLEGPLDPAPGLLALLSDLAEREVPMAVASSSRPGWIAATLRSLGIRDHFSVVVSGADVDRGKPEPDIYLLAADLLGIVPRSCVVFEDSPAGMLAGKRAGMTVIGIRTPYTAHLDLTVADMVVGSMEELDVDKIVPNGATDGARV